MAEKQLLHKPFGGICASGLRVLAMAFMLLDHLWATIVPGNNWMTYLGRLAFPIFAFQIVEGYFHTSDRKRYAKRLLILALIAELPFNLMLTSSAIFPFHQNTVFTLLLGLWAVSALDRAKQSKGLGSTLRGLFVLALTCLLATIGMTDYGVQGVLTVVMFYLFRDSTGARIAQLVSMVLLNIVFFKGQTIPLLGYNFPTQGFAVLALIPIWLYNGKKGFGGKPFQYAAYGFYPAHMLILYLLGTVL